MLKALTTALILLAQPTSAAVWEIGMYNRSDNGPMIYEPSVLQIAPGDTLRWHCQVVLLADPRSPPC